MNAPDHYDIYYADKLWNLLPAVYRSADTDGVDGPLREMVNRIGVQAAILRRSIDRMWEDQSIESCDDWVIPYIGQLLGTNLVASLDGRGQRLDVANTIAYRLRKGTLAIVEEVAANITGWDAKAVEFFRRLGRTRHGLDPSIGRYAPPVATLGITPAPGPPTDPVSQLQVAEGLVGALTRTGIGGFADLRSAQSATEAHTAFDEYFHTADVRAAAGDRGWYAIPKLGVFVWRLPSFAVGPVTPVAVTGCPNWYTFDPTGRDVPLFSAARSLEAYGDAWVSPREGQVAAPITQALLDADLAQAVRDAALPPSQQSSLDLYPDALSVSIDAGPSELLEIPANELILRPARGHFAYAGSPPGAPLVASYTYGFPSQIGAGTYDRRIGTLVAPPAPGGSGIAIAGGGAALALPGAVPQNGALTVGDSLTYAGVAAFSVDGDLTLRAANFQRPLFRLAENVPLVISGAPGSTLTLDGLFISGGDVVLRGSFASVTLSCCTLDPGSAVTAAPLADAALALSVPPALLKVSADGRDLVPTRIWVEAGVTTMTLDRCVTGPIRTRIGETIETGPGGTIETAPGATIETLSISNSIVQSIRTSGYGPLETGDVKDPLRFERRLQLGLDPVSARLLQLEPQIGWLLGSQASPPLGESPPFAESPPLAESPPALSDLGPLLALIDDVLAGPSIYDPVTFAGVPLSAATRALQALSASSMSAVAALNRSLLEDAFALELADAALALGDGLVQLSRCTILGRIAVHQLQASESILQGLNQVDDTQDGCVRFCAVAAGSVIPRQFESVRIAEESPLFATVDFGQPAYAQLLPLVDAAILPSTLASGEPQNTISQGATDGAEMGAYARDKNPVKAGALVIKLQEYMPAGLVPVIVMVT